MNLIFKPPYTGADKKQQSSRRLKKRRRERFIRSLPTGRLYGDRVFVHTHCTVFPAGRFGCSIGSIPDVLMIYPCHGYHSLSVCIITSLLFSAAYAKQLSCRTVLRETGHQCTAADIFLIFMKIIHQPSDRHTSFFLLFMLLL